MPAWLPGIVVALIGIAPGMLVWRQAAQARQDTQTAQRYANSADARRVDQAAYDVARSIYEAGLAEAQRQLGQRQERILLLERSEQRLERRIAELELALRKAGVPSPAEEP